MAKKSKTPIYRAIEALDENIYRRLSSEEGLQFVYELIHVPTSFQNLKFTMDAARAPLRILGDEEFLSVYGLPRKLTFKVAEPRETVPTDLWSILY